LAVVTCHDTVRVPPVMPVADQMPASASGPPAASAPGASAAVAALMVGADPPCAGVATMDRAQSCTHTLDPTAAASARGA